jgi:hypothetical protein
MMILAWAGAALALTTSDAYITWRRIKRYGLEVEFSPTIRWLVEYLGLTAGVFFGVFAASSVLLWLLVGLHLPGVIAAIVGFRARHFYNQALSFKYERDIEALARQLKAAASQNQGNPPPDGSQSSPASPEDSQ